MDWIDSGVNWLGAKIFALMPDNWFRALLIGGIIKGVGGVIVFLPNILILFFFISLLESTGYMYVRGELVQMLSMESFKPGIHLSANSMHSSAFLLFKSL